MNHAFDPELIAIVDYLLDTSITSSLAYDTARYCFLDSLGCALLALNYPACTQLLGPVVPGTQVPGGARVPGTDDILDPIQAAFQFGTLIRWLDYNDTWLAAEWGHPSDNLGGIWSVADYMSQQSVANNQPPLLMKDVLTAMIKAHEIQGVIALENSFNAVGLDHVILVKVATAAVTAQMMGGSRQQILNALSLAFVDGQSLRTYRHAPNAGSRKSWAAGDATARGVQLAWLALKGEMGYPSVLSAPGWGFYDATFDGKPFTFSQPYQSYVMEHILFKIAFPAEFHGQTAVECALQLHQQLHSRLDDIASIELLTQQPAMRIIDKKGPLHNPADRDHCLQYMVAIALIYGDLTADHYEDNIACDPRIDKLRDKMQVVESSSYTADYFDPTKRSIANAIQITFNDGSKTERIEIEFPLGHVKRREEGIPLLLNKFKKNALTRWDESHVDSVMDLLASQDEFERISVLDCVSALRGKTL